MFKTHWTISKLIISILLLFFSWSVQATELWREHDFDVLHYKIEVQFDHYLKKVIGRTTITMMPKRNNFKSFKLDAHQFKDVQVNMITDINVDFIAGDTTITIILPREYKRGEKLSVIIDYSCFPEKGLYFFSPDKAHPERPKQIWSQGEGEDNHHWFPAYDYPNDKATFELIATVDAGLTVISNGKLINQTKSGENIRFHYKFDKPSPVYLISIVIGEYKKYEQKYKNIPVQYFVYPKYSKEDVLRSFGRTPKMIEFFSDYIGYEYPYSKYAQTIITEFMYGGMENISATTQTDRTMHTEQAHLDESSDGLVAHELAHQWWGDLVTCREWSDMWLNEGFATYFTHLFNEYYYGFDKFSYDMYTTEKKVLARENKKPQNLKKGNSVYIKGASVLYMLRNYIGEESFRDAIRLYAHRFAFENAETHDFRKAVEDASGVNLYNFFDQWVFNSGIPQLNVSTAYDEEDEKLKILVEQVQDSLTVRAAFNLKLFIGIEIENDYSEHQIHLTKRTQQFEIDARQNPQMVIFDAGQVVLKKCTFDKSVEEWMYQAKNAHRVVDRIQAMEMLAELADKENTTAIVNLLMNVYKKETFYGARLEAMKAFTKLTWYPEERKNEWYSTIHSLLKNENKSSVCVELVKASTKVLSPININDFENLFFNDPSIDVRISAFNVLIDSFPDKRDYYFDAALKMDSWDEKIRTTALKKLDIIEEQEAFTIAKEYSKYSYHPKLRLAAVTFLGKLADKNDPAAINALISVVKEGGEHNRYRPVTKAIKVLSDLEVDEMKALLMKIESRRGNRYVKRAAKTALKKINESVATN